MDIRSHEHLGSRVGNLQHLVDPAFFPPWKTDLQKLKEDLFAIKRETEGIVELITVATDVTPEERGAVEIAKRNISKVDDALSHLNHVELAIRAIQTSGLFHSNPIHAATRRRELEVNEKERQGRRVLVIIQNPTPRPIFESKRDRSLVGGVLGFKTK